jgi:ATP-dependent Clp protease adaptor protein ClpS
LPARSLARFGAATGFDYTRFDDGRETVLNDTTSQDARDCEPECFEAAMTKTIEKPRTKTRTKIQRPPLYKVILLNDDYTPREFVVQVLKAVFRMNESQAYRVMLTAHQRGACVIAVFTRDVAETKAKEATELGKMNGYPLFFTTEPEE